MKKKLTENLTLKIVSVLVAVLIWLFASNASDPVIMENYSARVNVINDDYILKSGKTYRLDETKREVTVYIRGKTSVVTARKDIAVEADMTQIVDLSEDSGLVYVPVQFKPVSGISMKDVEIYPKTIPVYIEDMESKEFVITVNTEGKPVTGYEIGECVPSTEKVLIQGPKSMINKIKSVVATVNVNGLASDTKKTASLKLIDQNGSAYDEAMDYVRFVAVNEQRTIDVDVKLWKIVDNIKIKANYSGTPSYGYQVDKITTTPEEISVAGSEEALKTLAENNNTVEIPADLIDIAGSGQDQEFNIKLNTLLKEEDGFKIPENASQSVLVKVSILPYDSKEFGVKTANITIKGLEKNLWATFGQDTLQVRVKGREADLEELLAEEIQASIDLTDKTEGEYTVPVTITLPEGYMQVESVTTTVQLTKVQNTDE
ncbi:MAG: hypothetical protein KH828_03760 [Clostridiales bacterium]|nr:hypothetical protein [Clostridiales bacterium]